MASARLELIINALGATGTAREVDKVTDSERKLGRETETSGRKARKAAKDYDALGKMIELVQPAAKIAAIGMAAGGLAAAAAGAVALGGGLAPLVGLGPAAGNGLLAYATALGVVKASMLGTDEAFDGVFNSFQTSTPMANRLAGEVRKLVPELLHLRNVAQARLFDGMIGGLHEAAPLLGTLTEPIARTSRALGGLATDAGAMARELGPETARIMNSNVSVIDDVGHAGLNLAVVLVRLLDAARPLTEWLGHMALEGSEVAMAAANAGTQSGRLTGFFKETRDVAGTLGHILGDVGSTLWDIAHAGSPLGGDMLHDLERGADAMARWADSAKGQKQLAHYFAEAKPVIYETAALVRDILGDFAHLAGSSDLAPLIKQVRTDLLPVLSDVLEQTTTAFGPHVVDLITALAQAFAPLVGSSGPLILVVDLMTQVAKASTWIAQNVPGGSAALSTLFGAFVILKTLGMLSMISQFMGVGRGLTAIGTGADFASKRLGWFSAAGKDAGGKMAKGTAQELTAQLPAQLNSRGGIFRTAGRTAGGRLGSAAGAAAASSTASATASALPGRMAGVRSTIGGVGKNVGGVLGSYAGGSAASRTAASTAGQMPGAFGRFRGRFSALGNGLGRVVGLAAGAAGAVALYQSLHDAAMQHPGLAQYSGKKGWGELAKDTGHRVTSIGKGIFDAFGGSPVKPPGAATGGRFTRGGWAMVGEQGMELAHLPTNTTVYDHDDTAKIMSAPSWTTPAPARPAPPAATGPLDLSDETIRRIAGAVDGISARVASNELDRDERRRAARKANRTGPV